MDDRKLVTRIHGAVASIAALTLVAGTAAWGQGPTPGMGGAHAPTVVAPPPIRTTMEALHAQGGVPKGWTFLIPPGDAARGREAFVTLECFACHEVKNEDFPKTSKRAHGPGPDLTGMGSHHPVEYFAESIVNPNRVIVQGTGYTGADGLSRMPDYNDVITVRQLMDLVAYLKSLKGGMMHEHAAGTSMDHKSMDMKGHDTK